MESQPTQRYESAGEGRSSLEGGIVCFRGVSLKRMYERLGPSDGFRVFVDKLWLRGVPKVKTAVDEWTKDPTPSMDLRERLHEDTVERQDEFRPAYRHGLEEGDTVSTFLSYAPEHMTLVYVGEDAVHSHTKMLRDVLSDATRWQRGEDSSADGMWASS